LLIKNNLKLSFSFVQYVRGKKLLTLYIVKIMQQNDQIKILLIKLHTFIHLNCFTFIYLNCMHLIFCILTLNNNNRLTTIMHIIYEFIQLF
jgi:hypothetical protein